MDETAMTLDEALNVLRQYMDEIQTKIDKMSAAETEVIHDWEQWRFAANQLRSEFIEAFHVKENNPDKK